MQVFVEEWNVNNPQAPSLLQVGMIYGNLGCISWTHTAVLASHSAHRTPFAINFNLADYPRTFHGP